MRKKMRHGRLGKMCVGEAVSILNISFSDKALVGLGRKNVLCVVMV